MGSGGLGSRRRRIAYALSLTIYCTSWTFYGAVGSASAGGWAYLPIYLGPILLYLLGIRWLERLIVVAKEIGATSVADFIGARFGKSRGVAALVTLLALVGTVPYLALQLQSVGTTYTLVSGGTSPIVPMAVTAIVLALFAMLFGTRRYEVASHNDGVMIAVALESVVKIIAFLAIGFFAALIVGDVREGEMTALVRQARALFSPGRIGPDFAVTVLLAAAAAICLPRQFHITVVQAEGAGDIRRARWPFILYLALFSLTVVPITVAGLAMESGGVADMLVIMLPLQAGNDALAMLVFVGGFSAATGMVIVEMIALSTMVSNDLLGPLMIRRLATRSHADVGAVLLLVRRTVIGTLMGVALGYAAAVPTSMTLAGTGLVAFTAMAQFAPALLLAASADRRDPLAAKAGLATGLVGWAMLVLMPAMGGLAPWRDVAALLGLGVPAAGAITSVLANLFVHALVASRGVGRSRFVTGSISGGPGSRSMTKGELVEFVARFVGAEKARLIWDNGPHPEDPEAITRPQAMVAERLVASVIGATYARTLMASALSGAALSATDVAQMLDESGQSLQFSQRLLAATLENIEPAVSVVDRDLSLVAWNTRYLEMFGFPPGLIRVGAPVADAIAFNAMRGECGPGEVESHVRRRLANMRRGQRHSFERARSDGRVLKTVGGPMPGGGYVMCFTDITAEAGARKELEAARTELEVRVEQRTAELTAANMSLARATADKSRFFAAASHDLIQPLHAARLFLAALDLEVDSHPLVGKVNQSIVSAEQLLRALLDISRLDGAGIEPVAKPFALRPLLRDLVDGFTPLAAAKGLKLRLAPGDAVVESDVTMVRSIVQNLLANAVRYTHRGGVVVGVRRRGNTAIVEVWDSGIGIPLADHERIFLEFERLEDVDDVGIGLGLAIVKRTAGLLNAPISLASEVGRGSRFAITLATTNRPAPPLPTHSNSPVIGRAARILVVEDDVRVCEAMKAMLRARGHRPIVMCSAAAALAAEPDYDAALVDFHLGGSVDGLDLIAMLPLKPAALVTAQLEPVLARRAATNGIALLAKPLDPAAFDQWLAAALGHEHDRS